jgi:hypothetical protein
MRPSRQRDLPGHQADGVGRDTDAHLENPGAPGEGRESEVGAPYRRRKHTPELAPGHLTKPTSSHDARYFCSLIVGACLQAIQHVFRRWTLRIACKQSPTFHPSRSKLRRINPKENEGLAKKARPAAALHLMERRSAQKTQRKPRILRMNTDY